MEMLWIKIDLNQQINQLVINWQELQRGESSTAMRVVGS